MLISTTPPLRPGEHLVYRPAPSRPTEYARVEYLGKTPVHAQRQSHKHRVRFDDGEERDVRSQTLIAPWRRIDEIVASETARREFDVSETATVSNSTLATAVAIVLDATGEKYLEPDDTTVAAYPDAFGRIAQRANLSPDPTALAGPFYWRWQDEMWVLGLEAAKQLSRAFLLAEPEQVRITVEGWPKRSLDDSKGLALVRRWLGEVPVTEIESLRAEVAELRAEVAKLRDGR